MSVLAYKMLLRKRGAALSILAMALLVAVLASMNSIINYINLQAQTLGGLVSPGGTRYPQPELHIRNGQPSRGGASP